MARKEELRKEEEELRLKRKIEEKERWWSGAELHISPENNQKMDENNLTPLQVNKIEKYSANYSRWDQWIPQVQKHNYSNSYSFISSSYFSDSYSLL